MTHDLTYLSLGAGVQSSALLVLCEAGLPMPRKSACVFCPYTDNGRWLDMQRNDPASFERACRADEALRDQTRTGMRSFSYVHRSLHPLREIDFEALRVKTPLFDDDAGGFGNECEGMCGV